jgi:hypothetical protein
MGYLKVEGLDEIINELETLSKKAEELDGEHEVTFNELFDSSFMSRYTQFSSFDDMLDAGGFYVNTQDDIDNIPDDVFDKHISTSTDFDNWKDMLEIAAQEYFAKKLGFDD